MCIKTNRMHILKSKVNTIPTVYFHICTKMQYYCHIERNAQIYIDFNCYSISKILCTPFSYKKMYNFQEKTDICEVYNTCIGAGILHQYRKGSVSTSSTPSSIVTSSTTPSPPSSSTSSTPPPSSSS